ncbi:FAD binding domain-containing protein [Micromonospora sp. HUAS LYJ1]|uniref:FAD binding domain-containing protein n=1 Tax=Micromonospora sp. HUAS LYJ1 TaxID=3061626 RepID=UPI00267242D2|nr:FAD binding domain-containing protein [Micromonospora sp. HUAS LYJ1]WKU08486.1 FAD binding domain-containing protein [Micromonospora sp. HUAS LYJ1]
MAVRGGSQCGFCTPGFVCSMAAEYYRPGREASPDSAATGHDHGPNGFDLHALGGNLCRCTGYRPIRDAAYALGAPTPDDQLAQRRQAPTAPLRPVRLKLGGREFIRPASLPDALRLLRERPTATVVAGSTDWGVAVNLRGTRAESVIAIDRLAGLRELTIGPECIEIGAGLTLSEIERGLAGRVPLLGRMFPLFGSRLIRNSATIGGNLGTGSPVGDTPPVLLALAADVVLTSADAERLVPLADYFTGYRRSVRHPDELIRAVRIPLPLAGLVAFHKVTKRRFDDIASVAVGFALDLVGETVVWARIGLGGWPPCPSGPRPPRRHWRVAPGRRPPWRPPHRCCRVEARTVDADYARAVATELVSALVGAGTTTALVFGSHFAPAVDTLFQAAAGCGLRITSGLVVGDRMLRPELHTSGPRSYGEGRALARRWHGVGRSRYAVIPRFALSCSDDLLASCGELHRDVAGSWFTSHLNENLDEIAAVRRLSGADNDLDCYDQHGLVGRRSVFAHNVHPTDDELHRLAEAQASVAHCPTSNAALGSGMFPLDRHLAHGVHVALGCDVGAGTGFSLFKEALQAYLLQRLRGEEGVPLTAAHLLHLATAAGAQALGLRDQLGDLSVGKRFDAIWVRPRPGTTLEIGIRHANGPEDALARVFALATSDDLAQVWIDGMPTESRRRTAPQALDLSSPDLVGNLGTPAPGPLPRPQRRQSSTATIRHCGRTAYS